MIVNEHILLIILLGLLFVFFGMWLMCRNRFSQLLDLNTELKRELAIQSEDNRHKSYRIDELNRAVNDCENTNKALQEQRVTNQAAIVELKTTLAGERAQSEEKIALLKKAEEKMIKAFENLSNKILEEKSKKFLDQNQTRLGEILTPLRAQLGDFRKKIEEVYHEETKDRVSLHHQIVNLQSLHQQMSKEAINLTNALKGDSKIRGDWGEVILEKVLEHTGLTEGREYEKQGDYTDAFHKRYRPDIVVHLPNKRDVIIDSKVSLRAYERYYSAKDEQHRTQALKDHLLSVKRHIRDLKDKKYPELIGVNSLDMVLMFVSIEPALTLALENDTNLFQDAFSDGIFLVSPSTLSMNLQIIQNMWRYEYQNQNAKEIAKRAGHMYDKLVGFTEALEDIGDKLNKAQGAYDIAYNRLVNGKGNLIAKAEAIRELGNLKTSKQITNNLVDRSLLNS